MSIEIEKFKISKVFLLFVIGLLFLILQPYKVTAAGIKQISMGGNDSAALMSDGSLWIWGENEYGQLGNGTTKNSSIPIKILTGVKQVALGGTHSAAIKTDGSLWLWGYNRAGQLGDGHYGYDVFSTIPVKIMNDVKQVSLGESHSAAVKNDGSLWVWGDNGYGALGNGSSASEMPLSAIPIKIMSDVKEVVLGRFYSAAIKTDGSLWMWGLNSEGQLGNGSSGREAHIVTPVKILTGVNAVSLAWGTTAAVKTDGSLWTWGDNRWNQLGSGDDLESPTPIKIMTDVKSVSVSQTCTIAVKKDGTLWTWGFSNQVGSVVPFRNKPDKLLSGVKEAVLGGNHSAAVKTDGSLWLWGDNYYGQLGNGKSGEEQYSNTPVKINISGTGTSIINLNECKITLTGINYTYEGKSIKPLPKVEYNGKELKNKADYTLSFSNNKNPGTATILITGKGSYTGERRITFNISPVNISKCKITLSQRSFKYTGKAVKPVPTIKYNGITLKNRSDYTLAYKNNKKLGTATIVIKGKGVYIGQRKLTFKIKK